MEMSGSSPVPEGGDRVDGHLHAVREAVELAVVQSGCGTVFGSQTFDPSGFVVDRVAFLSTTGLPALSVFLTGGTGR